MLPQKGPPSAPTFSCEDSLGKFPLPSLEDTLSRLRTVLLPFCESEEEIRTLDHQVREAKDDGTLRDIQKRLEEKHARVDNYVHEDWWADIGYLEDRAPIVPQEAVPLDFEVEDATPSLKAAMIFHFVGQVHDRLRRETLPVFGTSSSTPISMNQFRSVYEACRIPGPTRDLQRRSFQPGIRPRFVVLGVHGKLFAIQLDNPQTSLPYSIASLHRAIKHAETQAKSLQHEFGGVGLFTAASRPLWAQARGLLIHADARNSRILDLIERSVCFLTLDSLHAPIHESLRGHHHMQLHQLVDELAMSSSSHVAHSRWYDKSMQYVVFANGQIGFSFEHSLMDAASNFHTQELLAREFTALRAEFISQATTTTSHTTFASFLYSLSAHAGESEEASMEYLVWGKIPSQVNDLLETARQEYNALVQTKWKPLAVARLAGIGRNLLHNLGVNPDSFTQMAFQAAYFTLYQRLPSTYESVGVLAFRKGRTETGRCASMQSLAWVQAFAEFNRKEKESHSPAALVSLATKLRSACEIHAQMVVEASRGQGIDRHLFALRCVAAEERMQLPALLASPLYGRASAWDLSTSNAFLAAGLQSQRGTTVFRPVSDGSVGIVYSLGPAYVDLTILSITQDTQRVLATIATHMGLMAKCLQVSLAKI